MKLFFTFILISLLNLCIAQDEAKRPKFAFSVNGGPGMSLIKTTHLGDQKWRSKLGVGIMLNANFHYLISKRLDFAVGFGSQLNNYTFSSLFQDTVTNQKQLEEFSWGYHMFNALASLKYQFKTGTHSDLYAKLTVGIHIDDFFQRVDTNQRVNSDPDFITTAELNSSFVPYITPEIGLNKDMGNGRELDMGIGFRYVFQEMLWGDFVSSKGSTEFSTKGQLLQLNLTYKWPIIPQHKRQKRKIKELKTDFESRPVIAKETISVKSNTVQLTFWDSGAKVDGDVISIVLNGKYVLEKYKLKGTKKTITITLAEGENTIVMHAHNEGRHPPNTAAILVSDGSKNQHIQLNADLKTSGSLNIVYKKQ
jgi:hypothetical protein